MEAGGPYATIQIHVPPSFQFLVTVRAQFHQEGKPVGSFSPNYSPTIVSVVLNHRRAVLARQLLICSHLGTFRCLGRTRNLGVSPASSFFGYDDWFCEATGER